MKALRLLFLFAGLALVLASCEKPQPEPAPEKLTVSVAPSSLEFTAEGGSATFAVNCKGMWYARTSESWIRVTPTSGSGTGTVTVTVSTNAADARTGSITVESVDDQKKVSVSQQMYVKPASVTKTISEIRALYPGKDYTIKEDILIEGIVISDYRRDTDGGLNNYSSAKTIIISDGEAGLMLYCDGDNKTFARGHKVRVHLQNQILSVYSDGAIQVKNLSLSNVDYLGETTPTPRQITIEELLSGKFESMYVAVSDVQLKDTFVGQSFYAAGNKGSVTFEGKDGGSFDLFTSQYAVFKDDPVPTGSGTLKGIAGKYAGRIQMVVSEKADFAGLTGPRFASDPYFSLAKTEASVSGDAGSLTLTVSANVPWTAKSSSDAFTVTPSSGTTGGNVSISYTENPSTSEGRQAVITFATEASITPNTLTFTIDQQPLEAVVPSPVASWLELPFIQAAEGKAYFSHDMVYKDYNVRNYSFWYDLDNRVALWVAYPLYSGMTRGVSRTDKWDYDPLVPRRYQGDVSRSYAGWDRGHQLPSADRLCTVAANEQTFYYTNITPQNQNLNQGIWEKLEELVRNQISSSDTVYVVTGCVLRTEEGEAIQYTNDAVGKPVAVPKAYFKAVLKYKAGSANGGYSAIGFWLENRSYGSQTISKNEACSVAELEKRTGFNFFHNLKDEYEKEAESKFDAGAWGL